MRRALFAGFLVCLVSWAWASSAACAEEAENKSPHYEVRFPKGKGEPKTYDMSKETDQEELANHLRQGDVDDLERVKQINVLAIFWDLGLWTLVVFALLYFILRKAAWKPMLEGLQKREQNIRGAIEDAQHAREEAQRLREQLQAEMNKASEKVRDIMDEARRAAETTTQEMVGKARSEIQSERDRLRREIETARDQALRELWNQTAQLAAAISTKVVRRQLSPDDHRRLVDEALAELNQAGNERQGQLAGVRA